MQPLTPRALDVLRSNHGIITARQLKRAGVTPRTWQALVTAGTLVPLGKGVYRIASAPITLESRCAALCAAHPHGYITGPTAGHLRGLRQLPAVAAIHLAVEHGHELKIPGVHLRQSRACDPALDVEKRRNGIRVAKPARLAFDLAADLSATAHQSVVEQILHQGLCDVADLAATARRLVHPRRPGSAQFIETLATRLPGGPAESHPELVLAQALQARGVPVQLQATTLTLPGGRRIRIDISVPDVRWGVEVDVYFTHFILAGGTADRDRDRKCRLIGWQVERATGVDLLDIGTIADELAELYQLRCEELRLIERGAG